MSTPPPEPAQSESVAAAARAALDGLSTAEPSDRLLYAIVRTLAADVDAAPNVRDRVTGLRALLDVCDRLDLVPSAPGRSSDPGRTPPPPAEPGPTSTGGESDRDPDNPFGIPDLPPAVGYPA